MFQKVLHETGNPALALQAVMFRVYQMLYYDWLPIFEPTHEVTTINAQNVVVPQQWTGFIIAIAILIMHFILTALTLLLFAKRTQSSLLGNAWQAVSQLVSPETQDIIRAAGSEGMKDRQVEALARSAGRNREVYALASGIDNGRIELCALEIESWGAQLCSPPIDRQIGTLIFVLFSLFIGLSKVPLCTSFLKAIPSFHIYT